MLDEPTFEVFALGVSMVTFTVTIAGSFWIWKTWCLINLEGAGRKIFVGINGLTGSIMVTPHPLAKREWTTAIIGPFVRPYAFVNPDRDNIVIPVPLQLEGAPPSHRADDRAIAKLLVSWATFEFVPRLDVRGEPGDHGKFPSNLNIPKWRLPAAVRDQFFRWKVANVHPHEIIDYIPGAAAVAFMNDYVLGEHISRVIDFTVAHSQEFLNAFTVTELIRVREDDAKRVARTIPQQRALIRGRTVSMSELGLPLTYSNLGEWREVCSEILTRLNILELVPYGIWCEIRIIDLEFPQSIVDSSRNLEARSMDVKAMKTFADGLATNIKSLRGAGMSPDVAGLLLGDTNRPSTTGPIGALLGLFHHFGIGKK